MFGPNQRLTVANLLPPIFVWIVIGTIWSVYTWLHLMPMLQLSGSSYKEDFARYDRGVWQAVLSQMLTAMLCICFARSIFGNPGSVPSNPEWLLGAQGKETMSTREMKGSTGDRRFCKWCQKYKPDRCHHCRICKSCVLRMDHHCPWIMNCVGFKNHKYFFLLVVYAVLTCTFIAFTLVDSVQRSVEEETPASLRFLLVLGLVLACIMGTLMAAFLSFHTYLMLYGMSTIEFCEKNLSGGPNAGGNHVSYDRGLYQNLKNVLGPHVWLWFLPLSPPEGSGLSFPAVEPAEPKIINERKGEPEWTGQQDSTP